MKRILMVSGAVAALLSAAIFVGCADRVELAARTDGSAVGSQGIRYRLAVRKEPRPLRIHHLELDLSRVELRAVLADDPDGDGPATAALEPPMSMAKRSGAIAMVNANPWQSVADATGRRSTDWRAGMAVEILGLSATGGRMRTGPADGHCEFWLDAAGAAHIGRPAAVGEVREAVAGFGRLVEGGKVVQEKGGPIHPRTALGLDASGRRLFLVVVDGRQSGYSEGMDNYELAEYMRGLGCADAMNLDGGGSSVMILAGADGALRVMNDPSTKAGGASVTRPIPVGLVVRGR